MRRRSYQANKNYRPRRQIIEERRDLQREREILSKPVDMTGKGEDPIVRAFLQRMATASNEEALEIALGLQKLIRGDASMLANPELHDEIPRLREQMVKQDRAAEAFERNRESFINEVFDRAERIAPVGYEKDKAIARGVSQYKTVMQTAEAKRINKQLRLDWELEHGPREEIEVIGTVETIKTDGGITTQVRPAVIRIMHRRYVLYPGRHVVPTIVANRYREIAKGKELQKKRKDVLSLSKGHTIDEVNKRMAQLDLEYHTTSEFSKPGGV